MSDGKRVIILHENERFALQVMEHLAKTGFVCTYVKASENFAEAGRGDQAHVCITSADLAGNTKLELLGSAPALGAQIIVLTKAPTLDLALQCFDLHVSDFVVEPVDVDQLVQLVCQVTESSQPFEAVLRMQQRTQVWNAEMTRLMYSLRLTNGSVVADSTDDLIVATLRMVMDCVADLARLKTGESSETLQALYQQGMATLLTTVTARNAQAEPGGSDTTLQTDIAIESGDAPTWSALAGVQPRTGDDSYGLSPRERDVLDRLLRHQRVSLIADELSLSPHTVRNHLKSIFRKVGVRSQNDLLRKFWTQSSSV